MSRLRIGIFGHYGNRNLGDEAITAAVARAIRRHLPGAEIVGLSINPDDTAQRHGIAALPIRDIETPVAGAAAPRPAAPAGGTKPAAAAPAGIGFKQRLKRIPVVYWPLKALARTWEGAGALRREFGFLRACYGRVKALDLLMISGSNQFLDNFGGPLGFPYTLFKWTLLARLTGTPVAVLSVGAGPVASPVSKFLIRWVLSRVQYHSFRDRGSRALIAEIGYRGPTRVAPDLAFSLLTDRPPPRAAATAGRPVVGLNPMPVYDARYWPVADPEKYDNYVAKLATFVGRLIEARYPVVLFSTQAKDALVIDDIQARLTETAGGIPPGLRVSLSASVDALIDTLSGLDAVVATRFHGVLLPLLVERPVVGICYQRKTRDLMDDMGQGGYALDLEGFEVEELWQCFVRLMERREDETQRITDKKNAYVAALERQYREVFGLLDDGTGRARAPAAPETRR
ncbi:MAG TPA: polysaccharide pyruvyl transferase family protein [Acidiferrobacterales bacterium]